MKELQRKQKIRRLLYSLPVLLGVSILTLFLVKGAVNIMGKEWQSSKHLEDLEAKALALAMREETLKTDIGKLKTEDGIKEEIKSKFNVTQEGEQIAVIVDGHETATSTDRSLWPWYKRWWAAIIGDK